MADEPETPASAAKNEPEAPAGGTKDDAATPAPATPAPATPVAAAKDEPMTPATAPKAEPETPVTATPAPATPAPATPAAAAKDEAEIASTVVEDEHARNARVRRGLLLLSLANWALAILAWTISAYLGITSPASIFVYTVLFVIGLFAATVAIAAYLLEKFAHRPEPAPSEAVEGDEPDPAAIPSA